MLTYLLPVQVDLEGGEQSGKRTKQSLDLLLAVVAGKQVALRPKPFEA